MIACASMFDHGRSSRATTQTIMSKGRLRRVQQGDLLWSLVSSMHVQPDEAIRVFAESVHSTSQQGRMEYCGNWDEQCGEKQEKGSRAIFSESLFDATGPDSGLMYI